MQDGRGTDPGAAEAGTLEDQLTGETEPFGEPSRADVAEAIEAEDAGPYMPAVDPVMTADRRGDAEIVGGFATSSLDEDASAPRTQTPGPGDEALAGTILRELREDALTSELEIEVEVMDGVAYLRGRVSDMEDSDAAEEVAGRVAGVREVVDELEVDGL